MILRELKTYGSYITILEHNFGNEIGVLNTLFVMAKETAEAYLLSDAEIEISYRSILYPKGCKNRILDIFSETDIPIFDISDITFSVGDRFYVTVNGYVSE